MGVHPWALVGEPMATHLATPVADGSSGSYLSRPSALTVTAKALQASHAPCGGGTPLWSQRVLNHLSDQMSTASAANAAERSLILSESQTTAPWPLRNHLGTSEFPSEGSSVG